MPINQALKFIQVFRGDQELQNQFLSAFSKENLEDICRFANQEGFVFTKQELIAAHRQDWGMRWMRTRTEPPQSKLK